MRHLVALILIFISRSVFACAGMDQLLGKWLVNDATAVIHNPRSEHSIPLPDFQFEISKINGIYRITTCQGTDRGIIWWCRTGNIEYKGFGLYAINSTLGAGQRIGDCRANNVEFSIDNHMHSWNGAPDSTVLKWSLSGGKATLTFNFFSQALTDSKVSTAIVAHLHRSEL